MSIQRLDRFVAKWEVATSPMHIFAKFGTLENIRAAD